MGRRRRLGQRLAAHDVVQPSAGSLGSQSHTYADGPLTQTVTVKVTDTTGTGASGQATFTVSVNNVAPTTAYVSGPATVSESGTVSHVYVFSISDPGADTVIGTGTTCGDNFATQDGGTTSTNTTITFACIFPDGPHDYGVQASATDSDGATGPFSTFTVHAGNVAPTATLVEQRPGRRGLAGDGQLLEPVRSVERRHDGRLPLRLQLHERCLAGATYAGSGTSATTTAPSTTTAPTR